MESVIAAIWVILGISFIIFIHELGHFLACRAFGIRVRRFYLGFAPKIRIGKKVIPLKIFSFKRGGTEYGVGLVLFGGFVDVEGQDPTKPRKGAPWEFLSKKPWQRAVVLVAGSAMNAVSAFLFFAVAFSIGVRLTRPVVGLVDVGAPAWRAGIQPGDEITEMNGQPVREFLELATNIALLPEGSEVELTVRSPDGTVRKVRVKPVPDPLGRGLTIGVMPVAPIVEKFEADSAAAKAGIKRGDIITAISFYDRIVGKRRQVAIKDVRRLRTILSQHVEPGAEVVLTVRRNGKQLKIPVRTAVGVEKRVARLGMLNTTEFIVEELRPGSPLKKLLKAGDRLLKADGVEIRTYYDILKAASDGTVTITLSNDGRTRQITLTEEQVLLLEEDVKWKDYVARRVEVGYVLEGSAAAEAGIKRGDVIVEVDGRKVESFSWFADYVSRSGGKAMMLTILRNGRRISLTAKPRPIRYAKIGIAFGMHRMLYRTDPISAMAIGAKRTWLWAKRVFLVIRGLFARTVAAKHLSGPVGIVSISYAFAKLGLGTLLYLLGLISINLAIVNLLPIPVLDGGHLMFVAIEKLRGKPVSPSAQVAAQLVGLFVLLALIVFVTYNDVLRLVQTP